MNPTFTPSSFSFRFSKSLRISFFWSLLAFAGAFDCRGQASFALANNGYGGVDAPVFDAQGVPLAGTNYFVELWGGALADSLEPALDFDSGGTTPRVIIPFGSRGYFFSPKSYISVPSVPPSGWAWLQVRAWDARLGATYEQAVLAGLGAYGESPLFYAQGGDPNDMLGLPAPLIGLQSFNLRPYVPEPSGLGLLVLGGAAWWWSRKRWRRL